MSQITPMINGKRHSWASIRLNVLGRTVSGFTAISYEDASEKTNGYGGGNMPTDRYDGKYEAKASVTLKKYEVEAIQAALPPGTRLQDIEMFDIPVTYLPVGKSKMIQDVIRNAEFTNNKRDFKNGDGELVVELELIISHVDWGS